MEAAEFGGVLFELITETAFLQGEIAQILLIGAEDVGFEHGGAELGVWFMGAVGGEFVAAERVETGFESGDAEETPFGIGDSLREVLFDIVGGCEFSIDEGDEGLIGGDVVGGQDDGAAGETGFEGVVGGDEFPLFGFGTGRGLGIGSVGGELGFGYLVRGGTAGGSVRH